MKRLMLIAVLLSSFFVMTGVIVDEDAHAASPIIDWGVRNIRSNLPDAKCASSSSKKATLGAKIINTDRNDFDPATGILRHSIRIEWTGCSENNQTRAYAVVAKGSSQGMKRSEVCPIAGDYGGDPDNDDGEAGGGDAYDCVKYVGDAPGFGPGSELACPLGYNAVCLNTVGNSIIKYQNYPGNNAGAISSSRSVTLKARTDKLKLGGTGGKIDPLKVASWGSRKQTSGSQRFGNDKNILCQYWKVGSGWSGGQRGDCAALNIEVYWTVANWRLIPTLSNVPPVTAAGATITPTGNVSATGTTAPGGGHTYGITAVQLPAGTGQQSIDQSTGNACDRVNTEYPTKVSGCTTTGNVPSATINQGATVSTNGSYTIPANAPLGAKFCFASYVYNPTSDDGDDGQWRYSGTACTTVAKSPNVHVIGGDLRTNSRIMTSITQNSGRSYLSWAEYGIFARNCNRLGAMTSGAYARGGTSGVYGSHTTDLTGNRLTFSNARHNPDTNCSNQASNGWFGGALGDVSSNASRAAGDATYTNTGLGIINSYGLLGNQESIAPGLRRVIYVPNGTVRINHPIRYDQVYGSESQLPSIKIIAKNIIVNANVTQIDATLIATGSLATCNTSKGVNMTNPNNITFASVSTTIGLTASDCNQRLRFNGAVQAGKIYLYRTYGADTSTLAEAAEVFNLRPDVYLQNANPTNPVATTDSVTDLPPRF